MKVRKGRSGRACHAALLAPRQLLPSQPTLATIAAFAAVPLVAAIDPSRVDRPVGYTPAVMGVVGVVAVVVGALAAIRWLDEKRKTKRRRKNVKVWRPTVVAAGALAIGWLASQLGPIQRSIEHIAWRATKGDLAEPQTVKAEVFAGGPSSQSTGLDPQVDSTGSQRKLSSTLIERAAEEAQNLLLRHSGFDWSIREIRAIEAYFDPDTFEERRVTQLAAFIPALDAESSEGGVWRPVGTQPRIAEVAKELRRPIVIYVEDFRNEAKRLRLQDDEARACFLGHVLTHEPFHMTPEEGGLALVPARGEVREGDSYVMSPSHAGLMRWCGDIAERAYAAALAEQASDPARSIHRSRASAARAHLEGQAECLAPGTPYGDMFHARVSGSAHRNEAPSGPPSWHPGDLPQLPR